ncbi:MAG: hypothetical protein ACPLRJ_02690 [Infirmifilum uzonense]|uniref:hypothetical protein n=1 Tax=Infirmifilum uzonense TaxID=1550241 RepID=UPI003C72039A
MRSRIDVKKILYALPHSRTLRELARNAGVSHTAVRRLLKELSTQGRFRVVTDDGFWGLTRVIAFDEEGRIPRQVPFGTTGLRTIVSEQGSGTLVMSYIPKRLVDKYMETLREEVDVSEWFSSKEYIAWLPNPELEAVTPKDFEKLVDRSAEYVPPKTRAKPLNMPDEYDLILIWGKLVYGPFARPSDIFSKIEGVEMPSKQVLSYHYRVHIEPGWRYTTYFEIANVEEIPFVFYYLRGSEAERVARALALLPGHGMSFIGEHSALYIGQPLCGYHPLFLDIPQNYDVVAPYGVAYMKLDLYTSVPRLWKLLDREKKEWRWLGEKIPITLHEKT